MPATVIADVFSGLPNPQWTIAGDLLAQLQLLLANLAQFHGAVVPKPPALGYRGLIVQFVIGDGPAENLRVWNGYVFGAREIWFDPDRRVERWLLEAGIRAVNADILKEIHSEIR
jgi:hypothetical protein